MSEEEDTSNKLDNEECGDDESIIEGKDDDGGEDTVDENDEAARAVDPAPGSTAPIVQSPPFNAYLVSDTADVEREKVGNGEEAPGRITAKNWRSQLSTGRQSVIVLPDQNIQSAQRVHQQRKRINMIILLGVIAFVTTAISTPLVRQSSNINKGNIEGTLAPSSSPTTMPPPRPSALLSQIPTEWLPIVTIIQHEFGNRTGEQLLLSTSPQFRALQWIMDVDNQHQQWEEDMNEILLHIELNKLRQDNEEDADREEMDTLVVAAALRLRQFKQRYGIATFFIAKGGGSLCDSE